MAKIIYLFGLTTTILGASLRSRGSSCTPGAVTLNNRQCTVECGVDHPGGDYSALGGLDFQGCINACASDSTCLTAQYLLANSYCYLKNGLNAGTSNSNVNGIVCPKAVTSSSPSPITSPTTSSSPPTSSSSSSSLPSSSSVAPSTTSPYVESCTAEPIDNNSNPYGRSGYTECVVDHPGGNYSTYTGGNWQDCQNLCFTDSKCQVAVYDSKLQYCYLKSTAYNGVYQYGYWGIVLGQITGATPTTASNVATITGKPTYTTPATISYSANPSACTGGYTTVNGRTGLQQCGVDHPGGDYSSQNVGSFQTCKNLCASDAKCQAASYDPSSGFCYLKSVIFPPVRATVNAISFPTSTSATTSSTSTYNCAATAPASPYLLNGGFERGFYDVDQNPNLAGRGGPLSSKNVTFQTDYHGPYHWEGCNAFGVYASSQNDKYAQYAFGIYYYGLSPGAQYTLSFLAGGFNNSNNGNFINFTVFDGNNALLSAKSCTYSTPQSCQIPATNPNLLGKQFSTTFTAQTENSEFLWIVNWIGFAYGYFSVDDVRLTLA